MNPVINFFEKLLYHSEDLESLMPLKIVEIELTDYKSGSYPNHEFYQIKNDDEDKRFYMKQYEESEIDFDHNLVWQTTGYLGDDYSGFLLLPLGDNKYLKCSYSC